MTRVGRRVASRARTRRFPINVSLAGFVLLLASAGIPASGATMAVGDPLQPDLVNLRPREVGLSITSGGKHRLRFTTYTVNSGAGPMELRSRRFDCDGNGNALDDRTAVQHTYLDADGDGIFEPSTDTASTPNVAGCFRYDAKHGHWHFGDFELFRLLDPQSGVVVAAHHKVGFCLVDDFATYPNLPGSPGRPQYVRCAQDATQGISVGWTDIYSASLPSQWIDVTHVPAGHYCLAITVDPANRLQESDDTNNTATRLIRLAAHRAVTLDGPC
jgi:hypothetical protein